MRRSLVLGLGLGLLSPFSWGQDISTRLFSLGTPPSGCRVISGLFPVGDRTEAVWNYQRYAVVMPPYKKKVAQSFQCGSQKGTLYFFDYATDAQKEHALLFAKPVLAKQQGVAHALPIREWPTGFVLVSFAEAPPDLLTALDDHLTGKAPAAAEPHPPVIKPAPAAAAHPARTAPPPAAATKPFVPPANAPVPLTTSTTTASGEPYAQMRPSISAQPFESSEPSKSIHALRPVAPPKPVKEAAPAPQPVKPVKAPEPVRERPRPAAPAPAPTPPPAPSAPVAVPVPVSVPILGKVSPPPPAGTTDLSSSVLESYASKMGCETPDQNLQTKMVCGFMQEFASGLPPELPFKPETVLIGPVYTVDANGRFTDLHYDALMGTRDADVVSFFSLPSAGGKDDFEIKQLVEARKAKTALPVNDTTARLAALATAKQMGLRKSSARSAVIQPSPDRRLFIRRAGDHWIVIGVSGTTSDAQLNTSLVVVVLY